MREMLLNASKSYYVGLINKHIANVEILFDCISYLYALKMLNTFPKRKIEFDSLP